MILCIGNVLTAEELGAIEATLASGVFLDGHATAGWSARAVKHNLQLDKAHAAYRAIVPKVLDALARNEIFAAAALPRQMSPLLVSRSETGMGYGVHVDNAVMGQPPVRTDLAFTLFLSNDAGYDGGELVIEDAQGEHAIKLPPGHMVLYPATTLHRVETVRSGRRDVAVGWVQSLVRDPRIREMLFDLDRARRALFARDGKTEVFDLLSKTYSNLMRLHAET